MARTNLFSAVSNRTAAGASRLASSLTVTLGLLVPTAAIAVEEPIGEPAVVGDLTEDSVLVATRKLTEAVVGDTLNDSQQLQPSSRHSEQQPELAEPKAQDLSNAKVEPIPVAKSVEDVLPVRSEPRVASRTPVVGDASDVAGAYKGEPPVAAARFHGVVPGVSTRGDLIAGWGKPEDVSPTDGGEVLLYEMPPFAAVDVLIEEDVVALIKVELDQQQQPQKLSRRLRLDRIKPVEILDETGQTSVGLAYPEKGMLFLLSPKSTEAADAARPQFVTHMVIQPLGAEAFALRADQTAYGDFAAKFADLEQAIEIDPTSAYANWQLAQLHRLTGSSNKAEAAAAAALEADPQSDAYRLCWAECLADQGRYDKAVLEARKVLDSDDAPSVIKAGALHLMGRLAGMGESGIADKAIGFHTLAIEIADQLATSSDPAEQVTAKRILIDAHLAVARQISRRKYARKSEIVGEWIGRASGLAEEMIKADQANLELRLIVARDALAALANLKPAKDPAPWIKEAEDTASQLLADTRDPMFRSRVEWQLGEAYFHALRIEHSRKQPEMGLSYADRAIDRLSSSAVTGEVRPAAESLVGRLYFHIGAIHAVHKQDHAKAVEWYDKAEPLLTSDAEKSDFVVPRRRGEALVSMAVSYWEANDRDRAVALTSAGANLMERAVAGGVLDEKALAVPYGNLATMHKRLGDLEESSRFAKLARGARGSAAAVAEATGQPANPAPARQAVNPQRRSTSSRATSDRSASGRSTASPNSRSSAARSSAGSTRQRVATRPEPASEGRSFETRRGSARRPAFRTQIR